MRHNPPNGHQHTERSTIPDGSAGVRQAVTTSGPAASTSMAASARFQPAPAMSVPEKVIADIGYEKSGVSVSEKSHRSPHSSCTTGRGCENSHCGSRGC